MDDELIERQITLLRLAAGERAKVFAILKRLEEELVDLLYYSGKPLSDISREDKARLLKQAQAAIAEYYGEISDDVAKTLVGVGQVEAAATAKNLGDLYGGAIVPALPTETVLARLVDRTLIQGAPSAAWWSRQAGDVAFRFQTEVATGLAAAETNDQIIRRIRGRAAGYSVIEGKRVYNYEGGVMQIARHHAAAQVQTSVATVAAQARQDVFDANDDVVRGYRQVSTLDSHTTSTCVAYSGMEWNAKREPIGRNKLPFVSPGGSNTGTPRHWNCRSVMTPITATFRELGIDIDEFPAATRAATDGPTRAAETFDQFLKRKGDAFTDDTLGPGRAQLWRDGKITLQQLLDQAGRPMSLKELRAKYG